jgi:hypothetical protein
MTHTSTQAPEIDAEETYNLIMNSIEPDLMTDILPFLDDLYISETNDEHEVRMQWYKTALEIFEERYQDFTEGCKNYYIDLRKKAESLYRKTTEENDEGDTMQSIEQSLQQS